MQFREAIARLEDVLNTSKVGILATVDEEGVPCLRWMTPALAKGREGCLYAISSLKFKKCAQVRTHPGVSWSIQSRTLDEIITIRGKMHVIENPQLISEIIERIGRNLDIFWRVIPPESDLVVLETEMEEIEYFRPLNGVHETIRLERGKE